MKINKIICTSFFTLVAFSAHGESLMDCAKIDDVDARIACYDRLAGRVEKKLEEEYSGTTEQRVEKRAKEITEEIVGTTVKAPTIMTLQVKTVNRDRTGRITYVTTDGRLFRKVASKPVSFRKGDRLQIEDGVLGSIFLVRDDGMSIKVKELATK